LERRLLNVVEEMAIASGLPAPETWILDDEDGINAFAAVTDPANAVVGLTRGCLERLSRDELQGVVAHEFSHILNGDMKLNMRLTGWIFGLVMIAMIGRMLLQLQHTSGRPQRSSSGRRWRSSGGSSSSRRRPPLTHGAHPAGHRRQLAADFHQHLAHHGDGAS
jgi:hypothetical protein